MPSHPRTDHREGFIRSHDLIEVLRADIDSAYEALEENRSSQYLRRCVVRAVFSFIEALIESLKVEMRFTIRSGHYPLTLLTAKEQETLGSLVAINTPRSKFLPLDQNLKRTLKLSAKIWHLEYDLNTDGQDFSDFRLAQVARNRLTHPRTFYDVQVTDDDMHCHTIAGSWVQNEIQRLFKIRETSLLKATSDPKLQRLLLGSTSTDDGHI